MNVGNHFSNKIYFFPQYTQTSNHKNKERNIYTADFPQLFTGLHNMIKQLCALTKYLINSFTLCMRNYKNKPEQKT